MSVLPSLSLPPFPFIPFPLFLSFYSSLSLPLPSSLSLQFSPSISLSSSLSFHPSPSIPLPSFLSAARKTVQNHIIYVIMVTYDPSPPPLLPSPRSPPSLEWSGLLVCTSPSSPTSFTFLHIRVLSPYSSSCLSSLPSLFPSSTIALVSGSQRNW